MYQFNSFWILLRSFLFCIVSRRWRCPITCRGWLVFRRGGWGGLWFFPALSCSFHGFGVLGYVRLLVLVSHSWILVSCVVCCAIVYPPGARPLRLCAISLRCDSSSQVMPERMLQLVNLFFFTICCYLWGRRRKGSSFAFAFLVSYSSVVYICCVGLGSFWLLLLMRKCTWRVDVLLNCL